MRWCARTSNSLPTMALPPPLRPRGLVRRAGRGARQQRLGEVHSLRLLAAGGSDPDVEHRPVDSTAIEPVRHRGKAKLGARVRPGWFVQTHEHPELVGRTLLEILHRGDGAPDGRTGMGREAAARALDRYELAHASEQRFESLSGGQQARFQILLLELSGATLLLLDEPTDNLDVQSAEALEDGLEAFEGTVVAVTHDRWFARGFDRFLVYGADGDVYESECPCGTRPGSAVPVEGRLLTVEPRVLAERVGQMLPLTVQKPLVDMERSPGASPALGRFPGLRDQEFVVAASESRVTRTVWELPPRS